MSDCVFDIETAPLPDAEIPAALVEKLRAEAEESDDPDAWRERLGLYSLSAQVVVIALINPDSGRGEVLYHHAHGKFAEMEVPDGFEVTLHGGDEAEILEHFWAAVARFRRVITYNGRGFDVPFLMQRSLVRGVEISTNLMPPRFYLDRNHLDLADVLSQFRATRPFGLAAWTQAIGATSPKEGSVSGAEVGEAFAAGRTREIAEYCLRDVIATAALAARVRDCWGPILGRG